MMTCDKLKKCITLLIVTILFTSVLGFDVEYCPSDENLNCETCRDGSGSMNMLQTAHTPAIAQNIEINDDGEFIANYVSIGTSYSALLVVPGALIALATFCSGCFCLGRCVFCCNGGIGLCGKTYPTPSRMEKKGGDFKNKLMGFDKDTGKYGIRAKLCAYACMLSFVLVTFAMIYVGHTMGSSKFTSSFIPISKTLDPAADMTQDTIVPISLFLSNVVSGPIVTGIRTLNETICEAGDLKGLVESITCIKTKLVDEFLDIDVLIGSINDTQKFVNALPGIPESKTSLLDLQDSIDGISAILPVLSTKTSAFAVALTPISDLSNVKSSLGDLDTALISLQPIPDQVTTFFSDLSNSIPGKVALVGADGNGGIKNKLTTEIVSDGCRSCGTWADTQAWRNALKIDLANIKTGLESMPNVPAFKIVLDDLNTALDDTGTAVDAVITDMTFLIDSLNSFPSGAGFASSLTDLQTALDDFDIAGVRGVLLSLNTSMAQLPDFNALDSELDKISGLSSLKPCLDGIDDVLTSINKTIFMLPDAFSAILTNLDSVKGELDTGIDAGKSVQDSLKDMQGEIDALPDFNALISDVDEIRDQIDAIKSDLDFDSMKTSLLDLDSNLAGGGIDESVIANAETVKTEVSDPNARPSQETKDKLDSLDTQSGTGPTQIDTALAQINAWEKGFCAANINTPCLCNAVDPCLTSPFTGASADCSGGVCNMEHAAKYPGVCVDDGQQCNDASTCNFGVSCTTPVFTDVIAILDDMASNEVDSSSTTTSMTALKTSLNDMPDLQQQITEIGDLETSINGIPDLNDFSDQFESFDDVLDSSPDVGAMTSSFDSLDAALSSLPDLEAQKGTMTTLNDTVSTVPIDMFDMVIDMGNSLVDLLYVNLNTFLNKLSNDKLAQISIESGLEGQVRHVLKVLDDLMVSLPSLDMTGEGEDSEKPAAKTLEEQSEVVLRSLKAMESNKLRDLGSLHYLMTIGGQKVTTPNDQKSKSALVWRDDDGEEYSNNNVCVTETCLANTITFVNRETIGAVLSSLPETEAFSSVQGAPDIPVSREDVTLLLYLIPVLVAVLGLLSMACTICKGCNPGLLVCFGSFACGVQLLLIVGLGLFPALVAVSDLCVQFEDIGLGYLQSQDICTVLNGTVDATNPSICNTRSIPDLIISVDIEAMYSNILGDCDADIDPLESMLINVGKQISPYLMNTIEESMMSVEGLRPNVSDVIIKMVNDTSPHLEEFFEGISSTITCEQLHDLVIGVKDSLCCNVMDSVLMMLVSFMGIGYAMIICGMPAGVLGYKRFPSKVWGPYADVPEIEVNFDDTSEGGRAGAMNRVAPMAMATPFVVIGGVVDHTEGGKSMYPPIDFDATPGTVNAEDDPYLEEI